MSVRELVILGSGAGQAQPDRYLHAALLRWDDEGILMDPAEGTQRRMIHADVTATSLSRIFISHFHADRCLGLAGLSQRISLDRVPHAVEVWFPAEGRVFFDRLRKASVYHAAAKLRPVPLEAEGTVEASSRLHLSVAALRHRVPVFGMRLEEPEGRTMLPDALAQAGVHGPAIKRLQREGILEVDGRTVRLDDVSAPKPGHAVAYVPDTRPCAGVERLLASADLALVHAPFSAEQRTRAERAGELTAAEAGAMAEAAGVRSLVLTGFRPDSEASDILVREARRTFAGSVTAAEDGVRLPIVRKGKHGAVPT
ncbi:MAG: ribonuclease Z [Myxococcota bacterium]